jgi:6,7-dimethyl-8-ribityllumazine synthase
MNPPHLLVVEAPYYLAISDELRAGALAAIADAGATCDVLQIPGAFEIPAAIALAAGLHDPEAGTARRRYDGYIALGCVIRGETTHYDYVCAECARGLQTLAFQHGLAVGFGVLTVENEEQAWARALRTQKNKGGEAANAALAMIALRARFPAGT